MIKKKVLAISGSVRKNSSHERILKAIRKLYMETLDIRIYHAIDQLPHFNPDVTDETSPPAVEEFRSLIKNADGVLICTPEYVFSLPGSLKNALEWTVSTTVFTAKPCSFIVASGLGEKTFESLNLVMETLIQAPVPSASKLLIQGARGKVSESGEFTDAKVAGEIDRLMKSFVFSMEQPVE
jgi:NAD(P)H-dependent FMN reductase